MASTVRGSSCVRKLYPRNPFRHYFSATKGAKLSPLDIANVVTGDGHTPNHERCPACELFGTMRTLDASLPFNLAVKIWLENHSQYIKPGTLRVYGQHVKKLSEFLQDIPVGKIHIGNIRGYQHWRLGQIKCTEMINAEINSVLAPILAEVGRWENFTKIYRPLPVAKKITRQSMSEEQERRLLAIALDASKPRRLVAGHCLVVMWNTGMGFGELRHLKRADCFLNENIPHVTVNEGTKNDYRIRDIPLNWLALRSMRWIVKRWEELGGTDSDQYILPHYGRRTDEERRNRRHETPPPIFTEPMGHIYRGARAILNEAGLSEYDPYDMRSHFGTKLLNNPEVSDQMFEEIFGHASKEMRKRYSRQRIEKKAVAIEKLAIDPEPEVRLLVFPGGRK